MNNIVIKSVDFISHWRIIDSRNRLYILVIPIILQILRIQFFARKDCIKSCSVIIYYYQIQLGTRDALCCHGFLYKVVASKADLVFFFENERNCRKAASSSLARLKGWKGIVKVTLLYESHTPRRSENRIELRRSESRARSRRPMWDDEEKLFRASASKGTKIRNLTRS